MTEEQKKLNLDDEFSFEIKPSKSVVAAVGAGVLVVVAGFLAYNIFAKPTPPVTLTPEQTEQLETSAEVAPLAEEVASEVKVEEKTKTLAPATNSEAEVEKSTDSLAWVARSHEPKSISGSEYVVKSGDTLWEIARGKYGTGFEWFRIAEANGIKKNELGYPLIYPGQVLKLP